MALLERELPALCSPRAEGGPRQHAWHKEAAGQRMRARRG